ncbi:MAG: M48 family metallopeptidase [Motiliproteus sp.]
MLQLTGDYYDGQGSKRLKVTLSLDSQGRLTVIDTDSQQPLNWPAEATPAEDHQASETGTAVETGAAVEIGAIVDTKSTVQTSRIDQQRVTISSRLANSPRYLNFPDGSVIETLDNDRVDDWIERFRRDGLSNKTNGWLHRLESNLKFVLLALVVTVTVVWGTLQFGAPAAANAIAKALPAELLDRASQETLYFLEKHWLQPTNLSVQRQQQLQQHFSEAISSHSGLRIRVSFRDGAVMGANAFALPDGHIIFTDQIVKLAQHDDELLAILGHEIGHVEHRHSQRRLIQNSLFIFVLAMITGDMSGTSELVLGLPVLFAELAYSRANETEADLYALTFLQQRNISPHRFNDLMLRLQAASDQKKGRSGEENNWQRYLSSHPVTKERIQRFEQ